MGPRTTRSLGSLPSRMTNSRSPTLEALQGLHLGPDPGPLQPTRSDRPASTRARSEKSASSPPPTRRSRLTSADPPQRAGVSTFPRRRPLAPHLRRHPHHQPTADRSPPLHLLRWVGSTFPRRRPLDRPRPPRLRPVSQDSTFRSRPHRGLPPPPRLRRALLASTFHPRSPLAPLSPRPRDLPGSISRPRPLRGAPRCPRHRLLLPPMEAFRRWTCRPRSASTSPRPQAQVERRGFSPTSIFRDPRAAPEPS